MKKLFIIFAVLLVVLGAMVTFITYVCEDDWCYIFAWQKASVNVPDDWKTYSSSTVGFSIQYDPSLTLRENTPTDVQLYKWGPTQSGQTEIYDGMILSFRKINTTKSIEDYINVQLAQLKDIGTVTVPLHDSKLNGLPAKQFSISALGDFTVILVSVNENTIIEASYMVPDPTKAGYQNIVDTILSTFKLVDSEK